MMIWETISWIVGILGNRDEIECIQEIPNIELKLH